MNGGNVNYDFKGNDKALDDTLKKISGKMESLGKTVETIGAGMTATFTTAFLGIASQGVELAGELEQNIGGTEAVFGEYAGKVQEIAEKSYATMGTSASEYMATINKMGSILQGNGYTIEESMNTASEVMQRATDVASVMGISVDEAMNAVTGAAKGNFTMMDNLGVAMNATTLEAYALSKGIKKSYREMTNGEKTALAYEMFLDKTAKYAGNFANESDTLAGSTQILRANIQNITAEIGMQLLPIVVQILQHVQNVVSWYTNLDDGTKQIIFRIGGLLAVLGPILMIVGKVITLFNTIVPVIKLVAGAFALIPGPILIVVGVIGTLVAAFLWLWNNCEGFRNFFINLWEGIKWAVNNAVNWMISSFNWFVDALWNLPNKVREIGSNLVSGLMQGINDMRQWIIDRIGGFADSVINSFKSFFGIASPSKEFAVIGRFNMMGLEEGMEDEKTKVQRAIDGMFSLSPNLTGSLNNTLSPNINVVNNVNVEQDPLGQMVSNIKTFSGGSKNDFNYGASL